MNAPHPVLVIDLEATCADDGSITPEQMEVIELGAVWAMPSGQILDRLQCFVRPTERPQLTRFCMTLTHIEQASIDAAPSWPTVAATLAEFAQRHQAGSCWGSWGAYDRRQIERECARHAIADPLAGLPHQNLKASFAKARKIKQVGMARALQIVGLALKGDHHRALSDALNIARLLPACCESFPMKGVAVVVRAAGDELVAALPDGRQLRHTDADELAKLLLAEGVSADDVRMPDWREGACAPSTGQKLAIWSRMRNVLRQ